MQPSTLTSTVPNGAPAGSAIDIDRRGRRAMQFAQARGAARRACRRRLERWPGAARRRRGAIARSAAPSAIGIVGLDRARRGRRRSRGRPGSARPARWCCVRPATSWRGLARSRKRNADRAVGERRGDRLEPDLRHLVDRERQHIGRQAVAVARQRVDQRRAVRLVVQQHDRRARRRPRDRSCSMARSRRISASAGGSA